MVTVVSKKHPIDQQLDDPNSYVIIDCTSHQSDSVLRRGLSPFYLGPVQCYDFLYSITMENAWQFSKVYEDQVDSKGNPTKEWFRWRDNGFASSWAERYPKGKGCKPLYSYFKVGGSYVKLDYIEARKQIYVPLYAKAVIRTEAWRKLKYINGNGQNIALVDFDGYNNNRLGMSLTDALNYKERRFGHAFVLAMLLDGIISEQDAATGKIKLQISG